MVKKRMKKNDPHWGRKRGIILGRKEEAEKPMGRRERGNRLRKN